MLIGSAKVVGGDSYCRGMLSHLVIVVVSMINSDFLVFYYENLSGQVCRRRHPMGLTILRGWCTLVSVSELGHFTDKKTKLRLEKNLVRLKYCLFSGMCSLCIKNIKI